MGSTRRCASAVSVPALGAHGTARDLARAAGPGAADRQRDRPGGSTGSAPSGSRARSPSSTAGRDRTPSSSTLRDPLADMSMPVTCHRAVFDCARPAGRRGRQRRRARASRRYYANARLALASSPDEIRPGRASASCSPGSSGGASCSPPRACSPPSCKRPLPFLPRRDRAGHRAETRPPSATCSRTPAGAGRRSSSRCAYAAMQGRTRPAR